MGTMEETEGESEESGWETVEPTRSNKIFSLWPKGRAKTTSMTRVTRSSTPVEQTPPPSPEEKSPTSYNPSTTYRPSPATSSPTNAPPAYPMPKKFPQAKSGNKKGPTKDIETVDLQVNPETCERKKTTKRGANTFVSVERCLRRGKTLKSERKEDAPLKKKDEEKDPLKVEMTLAVSPSLDVEVEKKEFI